MSTDNLSSKRNPEEIRDLASAAKGLSDFTQIYNWILFLFDIQNFLLAKGYSEDTGLEGTARENFAYKFELLKNFFLEVQRATEARKPVK